MPFLMVVAAAALVAFVERGRVPPRLAMLRGALESRWAPAVVGLLFAAAVWFIWAPAERTGHLHDELAYLLQSRLFSEGRWTAAAPPMPEFFGQAHIINDPVVASKYPPGHSLLLSLGERAGSPTLIVLLLAALRAGLTFALARRLTNGAIALATCVFLVHGQSLYFAASFFSQTTTGALLLVGWYAMLRWHQEGGTRWIALLALALGWCAITRPYSAVLFAIPMAVVVLRHLARTRRWRQLAVAMAVGSAVVAILPLWSAKTTGDWRTWPLTVYMRDYMPYDHPHFGYDSTPPRRIPPLDLAMINASLDTVQRSHTVAALPRIAGERFAYLAMQTWWEPVAGGALALLGLAAVPAAAWVGAATAATIFVGYLAHPTWASWAIYYMETAPILAFLTACGLALLLRAVAREPERAWTWAAGPRAAAALLVLVALSLWFVQRELRFDRRQQALNAVYPKRFHAAFAMIPPNSILFVKHARWHQPHVSLVTNGPDFASAPRWIAYDLGDSANAELMKRVPGRTAYVFDESRQTIDLYRPITAGK